MPSSNIKESVIDTIQSRYQIKKVLENTEIDPAISWRPSYVWKTKTSIIACEATETTLALPILDIAYGQILAKGLPVRIMLAYFESSVIEKSKVTEIHKAEKEYREKGIGIIRIDDSFNGTIVNHGISLSLFIPPSEISKKRFINSLHRKISDAYELYSSSIDPSKGVQDLGQIIEGAIKDLALQANNKKKLQWKNFDPLRITSYGQAMVIDNLTTNSIISKSILGKCRGFCDDRNLASHKAMTIKVQAENEKKLKNNFLTGLRILEDLPREIKSKGYSFKV